MAIHFDEGAGSQPHDVLVGSFFRHKLDNQPVPITATWDELVALLRDTSAIHRDPLEKDGLRDDNGEWQVWPSAPAICPAEYPDGALRRKANVLRWHWFGADIDNDQGEDAYVGFSDMRAILDDLGLAYVLHTTTKSRPGRDRYRLLMPLVRPIEASEFASAWDSAHQFFGRIFDASTHDPSRLLFAPAAWEGSNVQFAAAEGHAFDIDAAMEAYPSAQKADVGLGEIEPNLPEHVRDLANFCARRTWSRPLAGASAFLTPKMERDFLTAPEGGRFIRLMTQIAIHAISKGYPIDQTALADVAVSFDRAYTGKQRQDVSREARRALAYAAQAVVSSTSFESRYERNLKRFAEGR